MNKNKKKNINISIKLLLVLILIVFSYSFKVIIEKNYTPKREMNQNVQTVEERELEERNEKMQHLDNGIKYSELLDKKEYVKDKIVVKNLKVLENKKISFEIENLSGKDIFISNIITLKNKSVVADVISDVRVKEVIKNNHSKTIQTERNIYDINKELDRKNKDTIDDIEIYTPVYLEEKTSELLGVIKIK